MKIEHWDSRCVSCYSSAGFQFSSLCDSLAWLYTNTVDAIGPDGNKQRKTPFELSSHAPWTERVKFYSHCLFLFVFPLHHNATHTKTHLSINTQKYTNDVASAIKLGWAWAFSLLFSPLSFLFLFCFRWFLSAMASKHHNTPQKHLFQLWILPVVVFVGLFSICQGNECMCVYGHHLAIYFHMIVSNTSLFGISFLSFTRRLFYSRPSARQKNKKKTKEIIKQFVHLPFCLIFVSAKSSGI